MLNPRNYVDIEAVLLRDVILVLPPSKKDLTMPYAIAKVSLRTAKTI